MTARPPAEIGMHLDEVETPALLVDLEALERNLGRLAARAKELGVRLRPHAKTHKCAAIARKQVALGAVGVCCQTVREAEAMVAGGIADVLVSNEVVGRGKLARLAVLAREARVAVAVDDADSVAALAEAAQSYGAVIDVLVEINVGANRCGVEPVEAAVALAERIAAAPALRFRGLQAYHGRAQHLRSHGERETAIASAAEKARATVELLARRGLACPDVTGAGTGTYAFEAASGVYNELQCGSYVFMDADYARNLNAEDKPVHEFEHALFVYATVMSRPTGERAVLDAGLKALAVDSGMPRLADREDADYVRASDEHGVLTLAPGNRPLVIGDKLRLIPGHCDPTANLYDFYVGYRGQRVEALWPIARGPGT